MGSRAAIHRVVGAGGRVAAVVGMVLAVGVGGASAWAEETPVANPPADGPAPDYGTTAAPTAAMPVPVPPSRPALSIKVDDGTMKTAEHREHTYTVRLRNLGSTDIDQLTMVETLPVGLTLVSATEGGAPGGHEGQIAWTVDLPAGGEVVRAVKARVDKLPQGRGIASTACAQLAGSAVPVVCSTDVDQLPSDAELAAAAGLPKSTVYGGIAATLAATGIGTWYVMRRRRRLAAARPAAEGASA
ncbi:hypothetical protein [Yinghuangia seranimata]|uniref:hypothetical protein n=1 Tax=Yinghuangia seranimata TaxID=408067 RepID=UPI00248AD731|nr:hypothetical protein [Yinghuangia seranimata]MDI2126296.1 hypothetical protein [Yinghuangia seranimata]